ncbi:TPA: hypothetical protein N0F65_010966 [Lagenidium giganteum]|uniref:microtubule-severing ATPase n=1 Tax=Lagenidium giganteum TaxID=4803 RepID=A0AAV2ZAI8_9STRA|nr:TPA: hypothetical protein N0F65_010966 [Lagenidium giganteum]
MLRAVKYSHDEGQKIEYRRKIDAFMTRAEELKASLHRTKSSARAGSKPSAVKAGSSARFSKQHAQHAHSILDEVLDRSPGVPWSDVAGLKVAKQILQEAVILPTLRPDIFTGLRAPPRGVLLFGPPGTGKTLLAKAVATEAKATFFNISASTLTSKWVGEGEKLVRALFEMARELQPSVIFLDEMDALLGSRSASEHDASRRIKNQFFTELDGAASHPDDRILFMGATNLPQELDEAIIRRLEKRIYVPLPDATARECLIQELLGDMSSLTGKGLSWVVNNTDGYSGSDLKALCKDAALGPIRDVGARIAQIKSEEVRGVTVDDFRLALQRVRPSVSLETIRSLEAWNKLYGMSAV